MYLPYLMSNSKIEATEFLPLICDAFLLDKHRDYEIGDEVCYQTLSVLDLSKIDPLINSFNALSVSLGGTMIGFTKAEIAFKKSYNALGDSIFGLADFTSLLTELKNVDPLLDVQTAKDAISNLVIYKNNCSKYTYSLCGVNAFFPLSLDRKYILQVGKEDYSNSLSTKFTYWQNMCVTFGKFGWDSI